MEILGKDQLKMAESLLHDFFPQSIQVYGYIFLKNRAKTDDHMDVLVDRWPDFRVVITRPQREKEEDCFNDICVYAKDGDILKKILLEIEIVDWQKYLCLGVDLCYEELITSVAATKGTTGSKSAVCHMLRLRDPSSLPQVYSSTVAMSSLNESHIPVVNETWKFGKGEYSVKFLKNIIRYFPTCCILNENSQPVAWILTYNYCAMGMMYTQPAYRRKGYAKLLINTMSKRLHTQGYPVFCFIEEENQLSYRLFKSLGFEEEPCYRAAWFHFNQLS